MPIRLAGAAGTGALLLLAVGCAGGDAGRKPGAAESVTPAEPLPMKSTPRRATWTGSDHTAHPLRLTPTRLARGSDSDLSHIRLDDDLKGRVPYYLTFSYTNTGKDTVKNLSPERNFSVNATDGQAAQAVSLFRSNPLATGSGLPPGCRESGKSELAAGATSAICQIFMLPKSQQPATVLPSMSDGVTLRTAGGRTVRKMTLLDIGGPGVARCPAAVPYKMVKPDGVVTECSVHLLPRGDAPAAVVFTGDGEGSPSVTWRAQVDGGK
ncbi:hypothetical protein [Streptomyces lydicus]|uniref:hypothetical protein n=1 Tax=Streptomyces lydicus TaxID=47763 RepID=UPI0036F5AB54